ncbi:apolipoprotein N-acyltransferase [Sphingomonas lutea]|uniref:Apolipoprotein N-acyltransferase n=1 Tax=Sphingomonas lutea TaxID=1045317 RepID=A0A7G9SGX0_9SPHN|nr:apolipoprotein N-acyltransferase [Sphingomonas lutea]QNN67095.1 apolipoprotein N-acyltransferase [Sphingomonas lutea]
MPLILLAFGLGAASALAFEPVGWWPLLPVAFAILCELICRAKTLARGLLTGWAFGAGQFIVGLNWIATAFTFQSNMPAWLGWVGVVLLSLYLAVYPAIAAGLAWRFGRANRVALVLILGGAWAITEWLRGTMFTGFPWNPAASVLANTPLISISALIGTYGLSAFVVLLGGTVWLEYYRKWFPLVVILAVTLLVWLLPTSAVPTDPLTVRNIRVVQPNIGQENRWDPGFADYNARRLATLSGSPTAEPRLVLWPESAVTSPLEDQRRAAQASAQFERQRAAAVVGPGDRLLAGGLALTSTDGRNVTGAANRVFVIGPGGQILARYDKAHLTPYGEYLPMRPLLSALGLSRLAPGDTDFTPGPGPRTIDLGLPWGKVGIQICYEIVFSGQVVDPNNRPSFIFNPSNDAWFGRWGPPQHLAQARLRAAEEGLPVIRATPTGISAVIDARGHVVKQLPWRAAGVIDAVLPPSGNARTPFARGGNLIPLFLGFILLIGGIVLGRRRG